MKSAVHVFWVGIVLLIIAGVGLSFVSSTRPGQLDGFAQCLDEKGAVFYGAFWCPHCQATQALFGRSAKYLPYVECSTPDGQGQLATCKEKGITQYPTWIFADGSVLTGERTLQELSAKTSCPLPGDVSTDTEVVEGSTSQAQ